MSVKAVVVRKSKEKKELDVTPLVMPIPNANKRIGRPPVFNSGKALADSIAEYFDYCVEYDLVIGIMGLAAHIGISRRTILNYEREEGTVNPDFIPVLKGARAVIKAQIEQLLFKKGSVAGACFWFKNNDKWSDQVSVTHSGSVAIEIILSAEEIKTIQSDTITEIRSDLKLITHEV